MRCNAIQITETLHDVTPFKWIICALSMNTSNRIQDLALRSAWALFLTAGMLRGAEGAQGEKRNARPWVVRDSVAVRYFDQYSLQSSISPDGRLFFFTHHFGDAESDREVCQMNVYAVEDVVRALSHPASQGGESPLTPFATLKRFATGSWPFAFWQARWEDKGDAITFQGPDENGIWQYYEWDLHSPEPKALTAIQQEVRLLQKGGDTVLSTVYGDHWKLPAAYPVLPVTSAVYKRIYGSVMGYRNEVDTVVWRKNMREWTLASEEYGTIAYFNRDGSKVISIRSPRQAPAEWSRFDHSATMPRLGSFYLIDAEKRTESCLLDAPTGTATLMGSSLTENGASRRPLAPAALWADDQRWVILVNTALPPVTEYDDRAHSAFVIAYNLDKQEWTILEPLVSSGSGAGKEIKISQVGWLTPGKELLIAHEVGGKPAPGTVYQLSADVWRGVEVGPDVGLPSASRKSLLPPGLTVKLKEDSNSPPQMVAMLGARELALTAHDPALERVEILNQESITWNDSNNVAHVSGLLMPKISDEKVPLVVQAYSYDPSKFHPDGPAPHTYAAQALAARGVAVLTINIPSEEGRGPITEGADFVDWVTRAVGAVALQWNVDTARVGLVGFSRAGFNSLYAITHPGKLTVSAAVIDDAFSGTYSSYLLAGAGGEGGREYTGLYSGGFWQDRPVWLSNEISFNVDYARTATLMTVHSEAGVLAYTDILGAFRLNRKPFELLVYPDAAHHLHRPRQRLESYALTVEWMCFWLKGEVPSDPKRADRWAILRKQQDEVLKTPPPLKGKWVFMPDPDQNNATAAQKK